MARAALIGGVLSLVAVTSSQLWSSPCEPSRFTASLAAFAKSRRGPDIVNPQVYHSPSSDYSVSVDPSDRHGRGAARYQFLHMGKEVWAKELPFTLVRVEVTNVGDVIGYAYSNGIEGFGVKKGLGDFHVVIIDATGELRLTT